MWRFTDWCTEVSLQLIRLCGGVCGGLHVFIVKDILNKTEGGHCCLSHFLVLMPQKQSLYAKKV